MAPQPSAVHFKTFGCKANQYDTERMRQEAEAIGWASVALDSQPQVCVVNTCTVTHRADAEALRFIRRLKRRSPELRVIVAGCAAALNPEAFQRVPEVDSVVGGQDPDAVVRAMSRGTELVTIGRGGASAGGSPAQLLERRRGATRGWLKVQDGCDRRCSFCATRLARGPGRSRDPGHVVEEARLLARSHPELVITGIHIGHYGIDLTPQWTLSRLVARLLEEVSDVRFRLGSVEATEVDDLLLELMATSGDRIAPHLHMPLQSGADPVLRRMRRWHTREDYRRRTHDIAARMPVLGLGADVITGFPGETAADHESTVSLVEELPFTYLHVFPFSARTGTSAAELHAESPVPQRVAGERSRELRARVQEKGERYRRWRSGSLARVALEGEGVLGLTEDYLRVRVTDSRDRDPLRLHAGRLEARDGHLYIALSPDGSEPGDAVNAGQGATKARAR